MGLPGSLHCLGMCGPLALMVGMGKRNPWFSSFIYHGSRSFAYAVLGLLAGLVFQWVDFRPYQQQFRIALGLVFFMIWLLGRYNAFPRVAYLSTFKVFKKIPQWISRDSSISMGLSGFLNGFLPCGLTYSAVLTSLSTGNTWTSSLFMFGFGLGTLPMMFAVTAMSGELRKSLGGIFSKLAAWWMLVLAILFLLRGASLGIPYLSPDFSSMKPEKNCCRSH